MGLVFHRKDMEESNGCLPIFYKILLTARILIVVFLLFNLWGCAKVPHRRIPTEGIYHVVGSGQTLYRISKTYNVDIDLIMMVNHISDPANIGVGQQLFIPGATMVLHVEPYRSSVREPAENIVGQKYPFSDWRYITLHHSATLQGNAERFDRYHRRRGMGGLFYHFVIGNGTLSDDGQIEVGWRWEKQTQVERAYDVQICLVGNFNQQQVTEAQLTSLVDLINVLRKQYDIQLSNVRRHKDIEGCITECPGDFFPFDEILAQLEKTNTY